MLRPIQGLIIVILVSILGCTGLETQDPGIPREQPALLKSIRYTIQVGAFSVPANAYRLQKNLRSQGLDAYHFIDTDGLYRVRFGDFPSRKAAESRAIHFQNKRIISEYYIVSPKDYPIPDTPGKSAGFRQSLVETAERFLGTDYRYGGTNSNTGFDCSGLVMTVYKLNGLQLPRTSREQYYSGKDVNKDDLKPGDLVFFRTGSSGQVSHVGLIADGDRFIHAPGRNKPVRYARLSDGYFRERFVGARTYID